MSQTLPIISNDVSLMSSIIGLAKTGRETEFSFKNDLSFLNDRLSNDAETQLAVLAFALTLNKFKSDNQYCRARRQYMLQEMDDILSANRERAKQYLEQISIDGFFLGDFMQHIDSARENGNGVIAFAPTYKGGYERMYRVINDNVDWPDEPRYEIYDPEQTHDLVARLNDSGVRYAFISDRLLEDIKPSMMYEGSNKPVYIYSSDGNTSLRRDSSKARAFAYKAVVPELITQHSKVKAVVAPSEAMNFLKDIYLAKGIKHKNGMFNALFYVDDMLIGGAIYTLPTFGDKLRNIYLLSDFSLSRERKLSKLVAMLATSELVIGHINRRYFINVERVLTTAFTPKPVSMKYRGIFRLDAKKDGFLNYSSHVRTGTLDDIFLEWFKKYGSKN
ncbi:hypothetical protein H3L94_04300 [Neisseria shayeganii]|uniref:Uncharacterized protein n=1 Tax=Neisseria shayeganii TaxID=607712 RepID=A0A7D7NCQ0_9NEIS|nr:hypothetical protein [Neisseria shayeganii]QMT41256.1 hypothetical protein H3L94_04300 [Neisseria shayeganii]